MVHDAFYGGELCRGDWHVPTTPFTTQRTKHHDQADLQTAVRRGRQHTLTTSKHTNATATDSAPTPEPQQGGSAENISMHPMTTGQTGELYNLIMNDGAPTPRAAARGRAENISMHIYNTPAPLPPSHTARGFGREHLNAKS